MRQNWKRIITELNTQYTMRELAIETGLTESALHKLKSSDSQDTSHASGVKLLAFHKKSLLN